MEFGEQRHQHDTNSQGLVALENMKKDKKEVTSVNNTSYNFPNKQIPPQFRDGEHFPRSQSYNVFFGQGKEFQ